MFKSIFSKYISAFMTIIIVSFATVSAISGAMITAYSNTEKKNTTSESASTVKDHVENEMYYSQTSDLRLFIYYNYSKLRNTFALFTSYEKDIILLLTDLEGKILIADNLASSEYVNSKLPVNLINEVIEKKSITSTSDMGGLFEEKQIYTALPLAYRSGEVCGVVFSISTNTALSDLASVMIKTIITAMIWVMFFALIIVYFITEHITLPLKKLSRAAKEYAKGNFKARVSVSSNDEISQLAESFNNMATDLENHEKSRSSFIANISHDLRTPMTSISGFIDGILEGAIPPEKYDYYLNIVGSEVKRLSRLVSSLLEISRFEAGERKLNMTEFDICEMARQIVISFENRITEKNLDVDFNCDDFNISVIADKDAIHQILYNLCDNAIKFAKDSGKYIISIRHKNKSVFVSVYNEGEGISEEDIPFIFDRFYKSDKSRGLDKKGVGLGLYISKTIIDAHGQEIWAKSVYGEYCEFVFTLNKA